jgi:hypothetical protein
MAKQGSESFTLPVAPRKFESQKNTLVRVMLLEKTNHIKLVSL